MPRASRRRGFTLVELLVVIGIMGVMLGVATVAFQAVGTGTKLRTGMAQMKSTISLARQYAITHRQTVYVVFPDPASPPNLVTNGIYQSYRVYAQTNSVSGEWLGEWNFLPKGVLLYPGKTDGATDGFNVYDPAAKTRFPDNPAGATLPCLSFLPNGCLNRSDTAPVEVFLREGFVNESNGVYSSYAAVPGSEIFGLRVMPLTGRFRVREYAK